jgi:pimeloyl-ACP methyl ester carboxylesterase
VKVAVRGVDLFFDVDGAQLVPDEGWLRERRTILLLHQGPGFDHTPFKPQVGPALAAVAQVVYLDFRGHGRSSGSGPAPSVDRLASDVVAFCETLEIEQPVVLGQGFGSFVALRLGVRHPEVPAALVLAGPAARVVPARLVEVFDRVAGPEAGEAAFGFLTEPSIETWADFARLCLPHVSRHGVLPEALARADWNPRFYIDWLRGEGRTLDLREGADAVDAPVLVLTGEDDPLLPLASVEETVAALPAERVRLRVFPGARNALFRDAPEALDEVLRFLDELATKEEREDAGAE